MNKDTERRAEEIIQRCGITNADEKAFIRKHVQLHEVYGRAYGHRPRSDEPSAADEVIRIMTGPRRRRARALRIAEIAAELFVAACLIIFTLAVLALVG